MTRSALIVNPIAGKASGRGLALARKLEGRDIEVRILERFDQLPNCLEEIAGAGVTDLFVSSGDGTIQAIQTELAESRRFATLPRLCLLAHGTTNMTAADLGFRSHNLEAQASFITDPRPANFQERPTLRVANPRDGRPRHGMFLGAGAVCEATRFCQTAFNAKGIKGNWAPFATLASAVSRAMFTAPNPADLARFDRPYPMTITAEGRTHASGNQLLMLSTMLDKLILGSRPFWGGKLAPIRTTIFPYPLPNLIRWLVPALYGGETRRIPPGATSFASGALEITTPVGFVLDGEFFDPPENEALRIETGPLFTYIRG